MRIKNPKKVRKNDDKNAKIWAVLDLSMHKIC